MSWKPGGFGNQAKRATELAQRLSAERNENERLRAQRDQQSELAERALAEAAKAREAREDVQRMLAAATASEQRAETECGHARDAAAETQARARELERERGGLDARLQSMEQQLLEERKAAERALGEAHDRAWALSAEHGTIMQSLIGEREESREQLRALRRQVPLARRTAMARAVLAVAVVCLGIAGLLLPGLLGIVAGDERARLLDGFTTLSASTPLVLFAALAVSAIALLSWGLYLLRGMGESVAIPPVAGNGVAAKENVPG